MGSPREWPGAHAVNALLTGEPLEGVWHDRTQEYRYLGIAVVAGDLMDRPAAQPPEPAGAGSTCRQKSTCSGSPSWWPRIEEEARVAREAKGVEPLGADAVRRQQPHARPNRTKKSPAPLFHTASKKAYLNLREAYSRFVAAFRDAAEKLKAGDRTVAFPEGSFPPAARFVRPAFT